MVWRIALHRLVRRLRFQNADGAVHLFERARSVAATLGAYGRGVVNRMAATERAIQGRADALRRIVSRRSFVAAVEALPRATVCPVVCGGRRTRRAGDVQT